MGGYGSEIPLLSTRGGDKVSRTGQLPDVQGVAYLWSSDRKGNIPKENLCHGRTGNWNREVV